MALGNEAERTDERRRAEFTMLVMKHDRRMRTLAYRLLGSAREMEDVLQESYLKAYRAFAGFQRRARADTWLYRIVYNTCLDRLRVQGRSEEPASLDRLREAGDEPSDEGFEPTLQLREELAAALAVLSPDRRAAVLLVDAFGYDYRSAAEVLGVRPGTVASRVSRARQRLKTTLHEQGMEDEG